MRSPPDIQPIVSDLIAVELLTFVAGCTVRHTPLGRVVTHAAFSILYDANLAILERKPPDMDVPALIAFVRPFFQSNLSPHVRIMVPDQELADALRNEFLAQGFRAQDYLIMLHHRPSGRVPNLEVGIQLAQRPSDFARIDLVETELMREVPWNSPVIRAALRTRRREQSAHLPLDWYWSEFRGATAGSIALLHAGPIASIQSVSTRPGFRGRSVATTMVLAMLERAREAGHSHICLMAEADDWPQQLYSALGFDEVARFTSFLQEEA